MLEANSLSRHSVEITFDDGIYAKLVCPESGCEPATRCSECGRGIGDTETDPCYDCPEPNEECWVKGWFDNLMAEELLHGKVTVEIEPEFDGDTMRAHIVSPEGDRVAP